MIAAGLAFAMLVGLQVLLWYLCPPRGHYLTLGGLALLVLSGLSVAFVAVPLGSPLDWANAALLYVALALAYMVTYSALQGDSPTLAILREIGHAPEAGCSVEWLRLVFNDDRLIVPRLNDLVVGGLVRRRPRRWVEWQYALTPLGARLARFYLAYRRLLRLEKGG